MERPGPQRLLPVPLLAIVVLVVAVGSDVTARGSSSFTPACVTPGAMTSEMVTYPPTSSMNVTKGETVLVPIVAIGARLDPTSRPEGPRLLQGLAPMSYEPHPTLPGAFSRTFTQAIAVPTTLTYGGAPVVGYVTYVNQHNDDKSAFFGNSDSQGTLGIDLKRVILGAKTLRVRAGFDSARLSIVVTGFRRARTYAHIVSATGRPLRDVPLGVAQGGIPCGVMRSEILFDGATPGTWKVIVNTKARSRSIAGGAVSSIRVTR